MTNEGTAKTQVVRLLWDRPCLHSRGLGKHPMLLSPRSLEAGVPFHVTEGENEIKNGCDML